jgi:hypothetical protein
MTPGQYQLRLYRGDTYHWSVHAWTDEAKTVPADLTGATATAQIRDQPGGRVIVPLTCAVTLPNIVDVQLDATTSNQLPTQGSWDLQLAYTSGAVSTILAGGVYVVADITP